MKIFSLTQLLFTPPREPLEGGVEDRTAWLCDPLSHPAIEHMSQRELADLPFRRTAKPTAVECRS